ncbi:TetR family transcriptional regulator [Streptomyces sp. 840.1]|uniref:TetR/AcrR family transcriptional regulator n=1 Tax=Streptomyces sp. 840.1 TaxID=2485152 RepID=UPI000F960520|nr:TetR/AcrR family transcriptional regulator [Streptomyces sp. 840.1]ROQ60253.1 TetR family transcriptional regulator [Streptomyces sp. 840.1]
MPTNTPASEQPAPGPRRRTAEGSPKRGRARENTILAATLELVAENGFERLTIDAVAARAHASKATIYGKWKTKDELVAEALRRQSETTTPPVAADTGSLRGDLLATVSVIAAALRGKNGVSLVSLVEAIRDHPGLRDAAHSQIDLAAATVGQAISRHAAERGELGQNADVPACLRLVMAQLLFDTLFHGAVPDAAAQERLVDHTLLPLLTRRHGDRSDATA